MKCFIVLASIFAAGYADHAPIHAPAPIHHAPVYHSAPIHKPAPVYHPAPVHKPAPVYHAAPVHKPVYKQPIYDTPSKYQYEYAVQDDYSGVNFGQNEARDGYSTYGEYRVALPDCRTQIVKYNTVDGYSGNIMEVVYEGKPCYAPAPVHKPAPVYHAAPIHKAAPVYHG
jgi:hypothetical protein